MAIRYLSDIPSVAYMQRHEWEWLAEETICNNTGCTPNELQDVSESQVYKYCIEHRNGKYRYIGATVSQKRRMIEVLRNRYPHWVSSGELTKAANVGVTAPQMIARYGDVLPVEVGKEKNHLIYRYLPNDERSLVSQHPAPTRKAVKPTIRDAIVETLKASGKPMTATEISGELGCGISGTQVGSSIRILRKFSRCVDAERNQDGTIVYRYMEA